MAQPEFATADDILLTLVGEDEESAALALRYVHDAYGEQVMRHLNQKAPWLSAEDKADVLQDMYRRIWEKGRNGTLSINFGIEPLLMTMAYNAAVDVLRGRDCQRKHLESPEYRSLCEQATLGTSVGERLRRSEIAKRAEDKLAAFKTWLHSLPRKQMEVAYVLADCAQAIMDETKEFPQRIGPTVVYEEMLQRGMQPSSAMAVKRAMQEIRDKFDAYLDANDTLRPLR